MYDWTNHVVIFCIIWTVVCLYDIFYKKTLKNYPLTVVFVGDFVLSLLYFIPIQTLLWSFWYLFNNGFLKSFCGV